VIHVNDPAGKCQAGIVSAVISAELGTINAGGWRSGGTATSWSHVFFDEDQKLDYGWHWPERA
jgi:hypothetical protein